jgi:hypothetical protein
LPTANQDKLTVKEVRNIKTAKRNERERPVLFGVSKLSELEEMMDGFE